jgi:membrane associated rhomboid family serine protease
MADVFSPSGTVPRPIKILLIANISIFLLDLLTKGDYIYTWFALDPTKVTQDFQAWRMVTYMFVHAIHNNFFHILLNMLLLWMFGSPVVETMGERKFWWFYFSSGVFAGICTLVYYSITGHPTTVIGASGALFALMVAFAVFFPTTQILILFLFPVQARYAVLIFGAVELLSITANDPNDPIAHATHLGGALFAWAYFKLEGRGVELLDRWRNRKVESARKAVKRSQEESAQTMVDIDPILKKISQTGMASLTKEEREKLEKASELKRKQKSKIISLDDYRKRQ